MLLFLLFEVYIILLISPSYFIAITIVINIITHFIAIDHYYNYYYNIIIIIMIIIDYYYYDYY